MDSDTAAPFKIELPKAVRESRKASCNDRITAYFAGVDRTFALASVGYLMWVNETLRGWLAFVIVLVVFKVVYRGATLRLHDKNNRFPWR